MGSKPVRITVVCHLYQHLNCPSGNPSGRFDENLWFVPRKSVPLFAEAEGARESTRRVCRSGTQVTHTRPEANGKRLAPEYDHGDYRAVGDQRREHTRSGTRPTLMEGRATLEELAILGVRGPLRTEGLGPRQAGVSGMP